MDFLGLASHYIEFYGRNVSPFKKRKQIKIKCKINVVGRWELEIVENLWLLFVCDVAAAMPRTMVRAD